MRTRAILTGHDAEVLSWVAARLPTHFVSVLAAIGVVDGEAGTMELVGGAVLHNWSKYDTELSVFGPMTFSPPLGRAIAEAALAAGVQRMTIRIPRRSAKLGRFLTAQGWHWEGIQRRLYGPTKADDAIMYGMLAGEGFLLYAVPQQVAA